jgi:3-methyladenine DNA glycosylase/8-oxoguanine DNA glycosylase
VPDDELMAELTAHPADRPLDPEGGLLLAPQRRDVVVPGDPVIRRVVQAACQLDHLLSQQEVLAIKEEWRPYRGLATIYRFSAAFEPVEALPVARLGSA